MAREKGSIKYVQEMRRALLNHDGLCPIKVLLEHENGTQTEFAIKHVIGTNDDREVEIVLGEVIG